MTHGGSRAMNNTSLLRLTVRRMSTLLHTTDCFRPGCRQIVGSIAAVQHA